MATDPNRYGSLRDAAKAALAKETPHRPLQSQQQVRSGTDGPPTSLPEMNALGRDLNKRFNAGYQERFDQKKQEEQKLKELGANRADLKKENTRAPENQQQSAKKSQEAKKQPLTFNCFRDPDHKHGRGR